MHVLNWLARGSNSSTHTSRCHTNYARLKKRLNLPTIASRPPCPPRIYKKLYNYLNSALPESTTAREPQTPRKPTGSAPASARNTPKTPLSARKTPRSTRRADEGNEEPPEWVMSAIRALTKVFDLPTAAPHTYTGVEFIYRLLARMSTAAAETPSKRPKRAASAVQAASADITDTRMLSLIVIIFLLVFSRLENLEVSPEQYTEMVEKAVNTMLSLPIAKSITHSELSSAIEQTMIAAREEGWLQMSWVESVKPEQDMNEMEGIEMTDSVPRAVKGKSNGFRSGGSDYIGLGTMMQDATDYLGERQQEDYKNWKAKTMARVEEIEAA
jgi:origin recognition complex subunit 6